MTFCATEQKDRYPTYLKALDACRRANRKTRAGIQVYYCRVCRGWHIGHSKKGALK